MVVVRIIIIIIIIIIINNKLPIEKKKYSTTLFDPADRQTDRQPQNTKKLQQQNYTEIFIFKFQHIDRPKKKPAKFSFIIIFYFHVCCCCIIIIAKFAYVYCEHAGTGGDGRDECEFARNSGEWC